ncbi:N-acetylglucosamine-6-phosphate deacetylase [Sneathiella sp. P13V-1]|uniref:N-acetylglucosamine-6-phosphate deacetylase n=1 Tax=Sneathiella sp. P13V-1 TaxID=2697366 RepID=UPI00187BBF8E|nr:N-acetylglucosamine-6-phosphate deacetylase [Sneathiella sp. P13V-1]MBE7637725.1 N-acetylglucosamine-6-phosphate deacetylase [Sneathiella sp. P13V-1]
MKAVTASQILIGEKWHSDLSLLVTDGKILSISKTDELPANIELQQLEEGYLAPGFFDIQVNGGGDILLNDLPSPENLLIVEKAHRQFGSTSILPTLITDLPDKMKLMAASIEEVRQKGHVGIRGVHFEGPFINAKRKGVHHAPFIRKAEETFLDLLDEYQLGACLVTLAPEEVPIDFINELIKRNVIVAIGHTEADYETCLTAIDNGVTGFTHLFNAMPAFLSREPGPVGAAFQSQKTFSGVIADGHHIHPATLKSAITLLTPNRAMLVTDAMPPVGGKSNNFRLEDMDISVKNGKCVTKDGTLAGAAISMEDTVNYVTDELGFSLSSALLMASRTPATFMNLSDQIGSFKAGADADCVLLNSAGKIQKVYRGTDF